LLLALWLPLQGLATVSLHEHDHDQSRGANALLAHFDEACADAQEDQGEDCASCTLVHAFCHLGSGIGLSGTIVHVGLEGEHCLHAAVAAAHALAPPEFFRRPPLTRA
jgi:hypothetical protein